MRNCGARPPQRVRAALLQARAAAKVLPLPPRRCHRSCRELAPTTDAKVAPTNATATASLQPCPARAPDGSRRRRAARGAPAAARRR